MWKASNFLLKDLAVHIPSLTSVSKCSSTAMLSLKESWELRSLPEGREALFRFSRGECEAKRKREVRRGCLTISASSLA